MRPPASDTDVEDSPEVEQELVDMEAPTPKKEPPEEKLLVLEKQQQEKEDETKPEKKPEEEPPLFSDLETQPDERIPVPVVQEAKAGISADARARYLAGVVRKLERAKRYPARAHGQGLEGRTVIEFVVLKNGSSDGVRVVKSSKYSVFDRAAMEMVSRASPFEPIPEELEDDKITVTIPILFEMQDNMGGSRFD